MSSHRAWAPLTWAIAVAGVAAFGLVLVTTSPGDGLNSFFDLWVYLGLVLLSVAIVARRARTVENDRTAWVVITAAMASTAFAEVYDAAVSPTRYPSLADLGWLAFYPLLYAGMVLLLHPRASSIAGTLWLDGVTASLAAAALGAAILVELVLRSTKGSPSAVGTNVAYPLGDVLLLSAVFGVFSLANWRPGRRWLVLGLGVLVSAVADAIYLFQSAAGTYQQGTILDLLWPGSLLLIAWAAWIDNGDERGLAVEGRPLLAVPATCALVSIGILVYDHFGGVNLLAVLLATATLLAVLLRLAATFRENRRLYLQTHHEATTDALTGLGNRRKLLADLDELLSQPETTTTLLMLFDLDGFKGYNDSFGHPAGDALLARLGGKLGAVSKGSGAAYRLGGDEFCLVAAVSSSEVGRCHRPRDRGVDERAKGFRWELVRGRRPPRGRNEVSEAMRLADERLYAQKYSRRGETDKTMNAFLGGARESASPTSRSTSWASACSRSRSASGWDCDATSSRTSRAQRSCTTSGSSPSPTRSSTSPARWTTRVGVHPPAHRRRRTHPARLARIPEHRGHRPLEPRALGRKRLPGRTRRGGDPARVADHLRLRRLRGDDLDRPYRKALPLDEALEELRKGAGTQFDPTVVRVIEAHVLEKLESERAA